MSSVSRIWRARGQFPWSIAKTSKIESLKAGDSRNPVRSAMNDIQYIKKIEVLKKIELPYYMIFAKRYAVIFAISEVAHFATHHFDFEISLNKSCLFSNAKYKQQKIKVSRLFLGFDSSIIITWASGSHTAGASVEGQLVFAPLYSFATLIFRVTLVSRYFGNHENRKIKVLRKFHVNMK